jgi:hypothetical protein
MAHWIAQLEIAYIVRPCDEVELVDTDQWVPVAAQWVIVLSK